MTSIPRLLFAAPRSGGGKTTVTCAFLRALGNRGLSPAAFKCGPDYIDPMFHTEVVGAPGRNLDLFFLSEQELRALFVKNAAGYDLAVLEGVMGYYDGVGMTTRASGWHLADATDTPVILVLTPRGMSLSAAALVKGFLTFRERHHIAGLLLNNCTEKLYHLLAPLLERECGIPVLGYLPMLPGCAIESRHLGLVTAAEVEDLQRKLHHLAQALEEHADIDRMLQIARGAPPIAEKPTPVRKLVHNRPVIAYARDRAFCFYYQDNLDLLRELGACLVPFSPLEDASLPKHTAALYIGGGYPELYAERLAANEPMRGQILRAVQAGMPTVAECGGFQYLQAFLTDMNGVRRPMVGAIRSESKPAGGLRRFGYVELTAQRDNLLCDKGGQIAAHEFHHWDSDETGDAFIAGKPAGGSAWPCIIAEASLFAGYPHLYLHSNPEFARRFVLAAAQSALTGG